MSDVIELTYGDVQKLAEVQEAVNSRFIGKPKDIKVFAMMCDELKERCYDAGFVVEVRPESTPAGNWVPVCSVVGRVDPVEFDPEKIAVEGAPSGGLLL